MVNADNRLLCRNSLCFIFGMMGKLRGVLKKTSKIIDSEKPERILLIKTWGMGNLVLMLPSLKALREKYPEATIYFLSLKENETFLKDNPYIDKYYTLDVGSLGAFIKNSISNLKLLRKEKIDIVVNFDQFARFSALFSFFVSKNRVGFNTEGQGNSFVFSETVKYDNSKHMSETFYDLAKVMGVSKSFERTKVPYTEKDVLFVDKFLKDNAIDMKNDILLGFHVGCGSNFPSRRWPYERYSDLANRLIRDYNAKIYFTGTKSEQNLIRKTIELIDGPLGDKNIVFFKGLPCSPCITNFNAKHSDCKKPMCIDLISVDEVYEAVKQLIGTM